jgi:hypothetical protein
MTPEKAAKLDAERTELQAQVKAEVRKVYFMRHILLPEWRSRIREIGKLLRAAGQEKPL